MSEENVEVVRQLFSYWGRGDWRSGAELLDPNWELVFSAGWFVDPGRYRASDRRGPDRGAPSNPRPRSCQRRGGR
jgi:ketosteroid isomerase-like protein